LKNEKLKKLIEKKNKDKVKFIMESNFSFKVNRIIIGWKFWDWVYKFWD